MTEPTDAPAAGRGRPRPDATVQRDQQVLAQLQAGGPQTRKAVAEATGLEGKEVYLSFYRLQRDGLITRSGGTWTATEASAPA